MGTYGLKNARDRAMRVQVTGRASSRVNSLKFPFAPGCAWKAVNAQFGVRVPKPGTRRLAQ